MASDSGLITIHFTRGVKYMDNNNLYFIISKEQLVELNKLKPFDISKLNAGEDIFIVKSKLIL